MWGLGSGAVRTETNVLCSGVVPSQVKVDVRSSIHNYKICKHEFKIYGIARRIPPIR